MKQPQNSSQMPFMPSFLDDSPALRIQPSIRISFMRVARMDLPEPAPPHIRKKKETS